MFTNSHMHIKLYTHTHEYIRNIVTLKYIEKSLMPFNRVQRSESSAAAITV